MAIYHFSAKVISRAAGSSALAAAAYRSASRLHDQRLDRHHDFSNKAGVVHSEVMLPDSAPEAWRDRERLWNDVEAAELRKDAQLAREVEFAIPHELDQAEGIRLARDFVDREFVARGMVADLNVHWDKSEDGLPKPHAHVMLTMREASEEGFGAKVRDWNATSLLEHWREAWGEHVNQRLAELDIDARVDHRSLEAQGIDLEPQHKIGPTASRMAGEGRDSERLVEHHAIARANGEKLLGNPALALDAITHGQATFTTRDLARFVHRHSDGKEQFDRVMAAVRASPELVALDKDGRGEERFTSRAMLETEQRLGRATDALAERRSHGLAAPALDQATAAAARRGLALKREQQDALAYVVRPDAIASVIGYAGTGKSTMLGVAREAWEQSGYRVTGLALSGIAAENLETGSGIASRTIASVERQWEQGRELLGPKDVLVVDEAGMIGTRQMERVVHEVEKRGAKLVLVGDPEQLQAIEAGAAFRSITERHGAIEITAIRRQQEGWQRDATRQLATGRTGEAIAAYAEHGHVHGVETREQARRALVESWDRERKAQPNENRIILTHTRDEVAELNGLARDRLRGGHELGIEYGIATSRGERLFASGDRIMFMRNERSLGVKNGSLGRIESVTPMRMAVMLDDGRAVAFDVKDYADLDHGYAATIHKTQGVTVDCVHVLATPGLDRHAAYVALSRHRANVELYYGREDFADQGRLVRALSRERGKDMATDYAAEQSKRLHHEQFVGISPQKPGVERESDGVTPSRPREPADLPAAVTRHAGIVRTLLFYQSVGEKASGEQREELRISRAALNAMQPKAVLDLENAFAQDRTLINEASDGQTARAMRAMQLEAEMRHDPNLRADVFVQRWQALAQQRQEYRRYQETSKEDRVTNRMITMAKELQRDPQLESLIRPRAKQLGLPEAGGRSLGAGLEEWLGRGRSRGLGIGM